MSILGRLFADKPAVIASAILLTQAVFYYIGSGAETTPHIAPWSQFPESLREWKATQDFPMSNEFLRVLQPDDYLIRNYVSGTDAVNLFVGYFNSRRNSRAPHSPQWCLPGSGWTPVSSRVISVPVPGESSGLSLNEFIIEKDGVQAMVLYWYHQGRRTVASELEAQLYSLPDLVFHGRTDTALVRIIVPIERQNTASAKAIGIRFALDVYPAIYRHIS